MCQYADIAYCRCRYKYLYAFTKYTVALQQLHDHREIHYFPFLTIFCCRAELFQVTLTQGDLANASAPSRSSPGQSQDCMPLL